MNPGQEALKALHRNLASLILGKTDEIFVVLVVLVEARGAYMEWDDRVAVGSDHIGAGRYIAFVHPGDEIGSLDQSEGRPLRLPERRPHARQLPPGPTIEHDQLKHGHKPRCQSGFQGQALCASRPGGYQ
jgi:hypothetical protein